MQFVGEFEVRQNRDKTWAFFASGQKLADCLEDPHTVEVVDETHFQGTMTTGVAFIRGTFRLSGEYIDRVPPERLTAKLHGSGMGSGLDATIATQFLDHDGGTTVHWQADFSFSGPVATLGERMLRSTVEKKTQALFQNAQRQLAAPP